MGSWAVADVAPRALVACTPKARADPPSLTDVLEALNPDPCVQAVRNIPLEVAACAPQAHVDPVVYTPPALRQRCAGWYPGIGTAWENWGMPQYST